MTVHRSPCQVLAAKLYPFAPGADYPEAASDALGAMRRALAARPPADISEAALIAEELAVMVEAGELIDGTDIRLARALLSGLKDIIRAERAATNST